MSETAKGDALMAQVASEFAASQYAPTELVTIEGVDTAQGIVRVMPGSPEHAFYIKQKADREAAAKRAAKEPSKDPVKDPAKDPPKDAAK